MPVLPTWSNWTGSFEFTGSTTAGTTITYGAGHTFDVTAAQWTALLAQFPPGSIVSAGTSRTTQPPGSVGEWLINNVSRTALASYVCAILCYEQKASNIGGGQIEFI